MNQPPRRIHLGGMTIQQFEAGFHALATHFPEDMRRPLSFAPPRCSRWLEYYLRYTAAFVTDVSYCKKVYTDFRDREIKAEDYGKLIAALQSDFIVESSSWVGPDFTVAVSAMLGTLKGTYKIPDDWFIEAAIRDKLNDMGFKHTPPQ